MRWIMRSKSLWPLVAIMALALLGAVSHTASAAERRGDRSPNYPINYYEAQSLVQQFYSAFLFRQASPPEYQGWAGQVAQQGYYGLIQTAGQFGASPEFRDNVLPKYN